MEMIELVERTDSGFKSSSDLILLEVRSAIRRRQFAGDATSDEAKTAIDALEIEGGLLLRQPVTWRVLKIATHIVDAHNLRALDSSQLATAMLARTLLPAGDELRFVCSDKKLLQAAEAEGFRVWNPAA